MFSELYDELLEAYKTGNKDRVTVLAERWVSNEKNNPFDPGTPGRDLFYNASLRCSRWKKGTIDSRRSRVMVTRYVTQILELDLPNPYKKVVLEEPTHVFGVIPEEKVEEPVEEEVPAEEIPEAPAEFVEPVVEVSETATESVETKEPAEPAKKKHGFNKRRKG